MTHDHDYEIARIDDLQDSLLVHMMAWPVSMGIFGLGGSIAFGRYMPVQTMIVLTVLIIGCPIAAALTNYVVKRRRRRA